MLALHPSTIHLETIKQVIKLEPGGWGGDYVKFYIRKAQEEYSWTNSAECLADEGTD